MAMARWQLCWSSYNYQSFRAWFHHHATETEQEEALQLYTVEHRRTTPQWLLAMGVVPQDVQATFKFRGQGRHLPAVPCSEAGCERCATGRGGYQFRWVDARWTPRAALDLSLTPQQVAQEMYKPWPQGMRPVVVEPAAAGSSSAHATPLPKSAQPAASQGSSSRQAWNLRAVPEPAVVTRGPAGLSPDLIQQPHEPEASIIDAMTSSDSDVVLGL